MGAVWNFTKAAATNTYRAGKATYGFLAPRVATGIQNLAEAHKADQKRADSVEKFIKLRRQAAQGLEDAVKRIEAREGWTATFEDATEAKIDNYGTIIELKDKIPSPVMPGGYVDLNLMVDVNNRVAYTC